LTALKDDELYQQPMMHDLSDFMKRWTFFHSLTSLVSDYATFHTCYKSIPRTLGIRSVLFNLPQVTWKIVRNLLKKCMCP
jgi:hypothetical protein